MSLVLRSREAWLAGVLRPKFRSAGTLRDWFSTQEWTPLNGMSKKRIQGTIHILDTFSEACIYDAIKLAVGSFESAAAVESGVIDTQSCAWQFIKYYYAAYFAANAIMRLSGHACINLTTIDCSSINSWALAHGVGGSAENSRLAAGLYLLDLHTAKTPTFQLRQSSGKGGVHIQFWNSFITFLQVLRTDIERGPALRADKNFAIAEIDLLSAELKRGGLTQGSWLSEVRNAVNYRFEHGAWFPYSPPDVDAPALRTSFRVHAKDVSSFSACQNGAPELLRATRSCGFIVGWLHSSIKVMGDYARGEKQRLISDGALAFAARM